MSICSHEKTSIGRSCCYCCNNYWSHLQFLFQNNTDVNVKDTESLDFDSEKIVITTTTNVITDLVENIGGDNVSVTGLMGPGVDPHLYRPSANDVKKLQNADIVFYNGLDLEGKMGDIFVKIGREGTSVWAVSENIPQESLLSLDDEGHFDPHIWWDVELWMEAYQKLLQLD